MLASSFSIHPCLESKSKLKSYTNSKSFNWVLNEVSFSLLIDQQYPNR